MLARAQANKWLNVFAKATAMLVHAEKPMLTAIDSADATVSNDG